MGRRTVYLHRNSSFSRMTGRGHPAGHPEDRKSASIRPAEDAVSGIVGIKGLLQRDASALQQQPVVFLSVREEQLRELGLQFAFHL